jgi:hypothetical protein
MTWTKLSDDWSDDTWTLSDAAYRLHTDGLVWSNRKLLDCRIPKDDLPRASKRAESVPELLEAGFWRDDGDEYLIVHHSAYQRTQDQVLKQQEANRGNGAKGGRPPKVSREQFTPTTHSLTDSLSHSQSEVVTHPFESTTERVAELPDSSGLETQSLTQSPTETETERDGTGQDRDSLKESDTNARERDDCEGCRIESVFPSQRCPIHSTAQATA